MRVAPWLLWAAVAFTSGSAFAQLTVGSWHRLGEADPGATPGATGADPTIDSAGAANLPRVGAPVYSAAVPPGGPSTLAMAFNGTTDGYRTGAVVSTANDNFGIEAWVLSTSTTGNASLAYNGNSGSSGWGLFRIGATYQYLYGGLELGGTAPVTLGTWTHLALVRDAGVTTLYVNGVVNAVSNTAPNVPAGGFGIAINSVFNQEFHAGRIDEVRVFTFAPGTFNTRDLLLAQAPARPVPTLGGYAQIALALMLALMGAIRLRRTRLGRLPRR